MSALAEIGKTVIIHRDELMYHLGPSIVIRDNLPNRDLGYPTAIEYESGRLFVIYWGHETGEVSCIQGTYVNLT